MLSMQKHVSFVRHRCLKVLFVHLNDIWILMRESKVRIAIQIIQVLSTFKCALFAVVDRLSATTDASSRTCHNFYEVIVHFTGFDLANQFSCISKSADY